MSDSRREGVQGFETKGEDWQQVIYSYFSNILTLVIKWYREGEISENFEHFKR